jgi:membrane peptidoglycan carboxypeptidase
MVEIVGAVKLWLTMSKRQILELYLNLAPFGTRRYVGIAAAARYYFSKTPTALTPAESIMLISFLSHPPGDVMKNLKHVCFWYRERVQRLVASGRLSIPSAMVNAYFADPTFMITPLNDTHNGIFIDRAYEDVAKILIKNPAIGLDYSGLTIETTLDKATNDTVQVILNNALSRYPGAKASFSLLDQNEQPVIYTNSYPTERGDFDLIYSTGSLPASRMKFPIYTLLIEKLRSTKNMTGREIFRMMLPTSFKVSEHFTVRDGFHEAYVPLYRAFALSSNAAAYFILNRILSPMFVVDRLRMFDLHLLPYKSLALGSQPVSELRLAATYDAIVLRNGFYKQPSFVTRILNKSGEVIYQDDENLTGRQEVSSESCRIAKELLREASDVGTTHALSGLKILAGHDFGAKTGTTERDKQLGVTGFLDRYCFSLHLESDKSFPGESEAVAVPILTKILTLLVERGY